MFSFSFYCFSFQQFFKSVTEQEWRNQEIVLPKYGFYFLLANWFNYLKPTIQLKTFTNIYKVII